MIRFQSVHGEFFFAVINSGKFSCEMHFTKANWCRRIKLWQEMLVYGYTNQTFFARAGGASPAHKAIIHAV